MTESIESHTYEANFHRLAEVVESLERDTLGLEESLSLFEEGMKLAECCDAQLRRVEERIKVLVEGGAPKPTLATRSELPLDVVEVDTKPENHDVQSSPSELS